MVKKFLVTAVVVFGILFLGNLLKRDPKELAPPKMVAVDYVTIPITFFYNGMDCDFKVWISDETYIDYPKTAEFTARTKEFPGVVPVPDIWLKTDKVGIRISFQPGKFKRTDYFYAFPHWNGSGNPPDFALRVKDSEPCLSWRGERQCMPAISARFFEDHKE